MWKRNSFTPFPGTGLPSPSLQWNSSTFLFVIFILYWGYSWFCVQVDGKVVQFYMREREREKENSHCCFWLFATPWTVTSQASLSTELSSKNTGVGHHFLLQRILPTQGFNSSLLHCRQILNRWTTSGVLQLYIYQYMYPFFIRFLSIIGYYRILSRFPCALQ